jgi:hypothetical protein
MSAAGLVDLRAALAAVASEVEIAVVRYPVAVVPVDLHRASADRLRVGWPDLGVMTKRILIRLPEWIIPIRRC